MTEYIIQIHGGWTTKARYEVEAPSRKLAVQVAVNFFKTTYPSKKIQAVHAVAAEDAYKLPSFK